MLKIDEIANSFLELKRAKGQKFLEEVSQSLKREGNKK